MASKAGRRVGKLTARFVETVAKPGLYGDGRPHRGGYCSDRKCSHSVVVDAMTFFVEIGIRPRPVGESTLPGQNY